MGIEGEMDPGIFGAAREAVQALSHDSLACLGRVMLTSSRLRIVGVPQVPKHVLPPCLFACEG